MAITNWIYFCISENNMILGAEAVKFRAGTPRLSVNPCLHLFLMVRWNEEVSSCLRARSIIVFASCSGAVQWVLRDCIARNPERSPLASPQMTQPSNSEIFPLVLETRPVSRKPMGRWKEFKRKDCQILLHLSEILRVEERQWEECFCEDFCPTSICIPLSTLSFSLCPVVCLSLSFCLPVCAWISQPACLSVCLPGGQFAARSTHHLFLNLQPCHRLLSPLMMWTSTLRPRPTTRSTVASRGPRSSWRSGTATAWRGWVTRSSQDTTPLIKEEISKIWIA